MRMSPAWAASPSTTERSVEVCACSPEPQAVSSGPAASRAAAAMRPREWMRAPTGAAPRVTLVERLTSSGSPWWQSGGSRAEVIRRVGWMPATSRRRQRSGRPETSRERSTAGQQQTDVDGGHQQGRPKGRPGPRSSTEQQTDHHGGRGPPNRRRAEGPGAPAPSKAPAVSAHHGGQGCPGSPRVTKAGNSPKATTYGATETAVDFSRMLYAQPATTPIRYAAAARGPDSRHNGTSRISAVTAAPLTTVADTAPAAIGLSARLVRCPRPSSAGRL